MYLFVGMFTVLAILVMFHAPDVRVMYQLLCQSIFASLFIAIIKLILSIGMNVIL